MILLFYSFFVSLKSTEPTVILPIFSTLCHFFHIQPPCSSNFSSGHSDTKWLNSRYNKCCDSKLLTFSMIYNIDSQDETCHCWKTVGCFITVTLLPSEAELLYNVMACMGPQLFSSVWSPIQGTLLLCFFSSPLGFSCTGFFCAAKLCNNEKKGQWLLRVLFREVVWRIALSLTIYTHKPVSEHAHANTHTFTHILKGWLSL